MPPKLYKAADVCEMAQVQAYVLRSWESEFPGIGVQKSPDSPRLYRETDVEQVLRIKQLVFGEGLTLSGARRRLEEQSGSATGVTDAEVAEVLDALGAAARTRIANVQQGLRSILRLLGQEPSALPAAARAPQARTTSRGKNGKNGSPKAGSSKGRAAMARPKTRVVAKPARAGKASSSARKTKRARA
jgi:DNA-binding transcriptional MerR regulator